MLVAIALSLLTVKINVVLEISINNCYNSITQLTEEKARATLKL